MRCGCINCELSRLTDRLSDYRLWRSLELERITGTRKGDEVALEIKGLKANMLKVAKRIESLNNLATDFDAAGGELEQGLKDIKAQVEAHGDDLKFAATVLGNSTTSSNESDKSDDKPKTDAVTLTTSANGAQPVVIEPGAPEVASPAPAFQHQ